MWVSTFHSACSRILRRDATGDRLPVVVLDLRPGRRRAPHRLRAPRPQPRPEAVPAPPAARADLGDEERARDPGGGRRPGRRRRPSEASPRSTSSTRSACSNASALDFDDLLMLVVRLFREHPEVLARWRSRFHHVLVDEFQDTNVAQWELVRMLTEEHRNVMVVGDTDQCLVAGTQVTMGDGTHEGDRGRRTSATRCCRATAAATSGRRAWCARTSRTARRRVSRSRSRAAVGSSRHPTTSTSPASRGRVGRRGPGT